MGNIQAHPKFGAVYLPALLFRTFNLSHRFIQRNNPRFADLMTINLAQVFNRFFHTVAGQADVVDGDKFVVVVDQLAIFFLVHGFDCVPIGIENFGWVFVFLQHLVDQFLVEFFRTDKVEHGHVDLVVEAVFGLGKAALDIGDDQGQEVVTQTGALRDQRGQRNIRGCTDHQRVPFQSSVWEQIIQVRFESVQIHVRQFVVFRQGHDGNH